MKVCKFYIIFIFLFQIFLPVFSQSGKRCKDFITSDYLTEGQSYTIKLNRSNTARIFLSFFEGYQYRFIICSREIKNYKIYLYDIEKKLLFSGTCDNFAKSWDFIFKSTIACIAELEVEGKQKPNASFDLVLGFKDLEAKADKKLKKEK
jgi:hypothetical protein